MQQHHISGIYHKKDFLHSAPFITTQRGKQNRVSDSDSCISNRPCCVKRWDEMTGEDITCTWWYMDCHYWGLSNIRNCIAHPSFPSSSCFWEAFYQAHNYVKAFCKIKRDPGAEDDLVSASICHEGLQSRCSARKQTNTNPGTPLESWVMQCSVCIRRRSKYGHQREKH